MLAEDGNTYDTGTIEFTGELEEGTYRQLNIYEIEYEGEYRVKGAAITRV